MGIIFDINKRKKELGKLKHLQIGKAIFGVKVHNKTLSEIHYQILSELTQPRP